MFKPFKILLLATQQHLGQKKKNLMLLAFIINICCISFFSIILTFPEIHRMSRCLILWSPYMLLPSCNAALRIKLFLFVKSLHLQLVQNKIHTLACNIINVPLLLVLQAFWILFITCYFGSCIWSHLQARGTYSV